jgi:integrase
LRHTTATHLIEAGLPLAVVTNILGHASSQSTPIYVETTQQTIDQSMREWNEKLSSQNGVKEELLPNIQNVLPKFLH